ncbi:MAG: hypothetical protein JSW73_00765 [Candidatus Woesearchaeota archaeon]|nr:MAG: hypothetical protein JSW73_00765 [Candidatus Woesearchaeota archaeon]
MRQRRDYSKRANINDALIKQSLLNGSRAVFSGEVAGAMSGIPKDIAMLILDAYKSGRREEPDRDLTIYCDGVTESQLNELLSNFNDVKTMQNQKYDLLEIHRTTPYNGRGSASERKPCYTLLATADPDGKRSEARKLQTKEDKEKIFPVIKDKCINYISTLEERLNGKVDEAYIVGALAEPNGVFLYYPKSKLIVTPVTIDIIRKKRGTAKIAGTLARELEKDYKFHISPMFHHSKPRDLTPHAIKIWPQ